VICLQFNLREHSVHQEHFALLDHHFLLTALQGNTVLKQVSYHPMEIALLVISALREASLVHKNHVMLVVTVQKEVLDL